MHLLPHKTRPRKPQTSKKKSPFKIENQAHSKHNIKYIFSNLDSPFSNKKFKTGNIKRKKSSNYTI